MNEVYLTAEVLNAYAEHLNSEEHAEGTVEKYLRDLRQFAAWLDGRCVDKEAAAGWKAYLLEQGLTPATINSKLAALSGFLDFVGLSSCKVKNLRVQRRIFRKQSQELSRKEYERLVKTARTMKRERLALIIETICATGIRVSELRFITVAAAKSGRAEISLKGKIRTIIISSELKRRLLSYAQKYKIASGEIFITRSGKGVSRKQIWAEMKSLCKAAGVEATKVFPHNLRHLFAVTYYNATRDIAKLADVLGHSSIDTTRIYLITTGQEHSRQLEQLGLLL